MRTFSVLKGQPVFEKVSGTKIGEICDVSISNGATVEGLLVKKGVFFKQTYFLDIQNVTSFGLDGVIIDDTSKLEKLNEGPEYTFAHQQAISGKLMLSKSGDSLGLLKDVYFMEELGTIVGYEVTDGFFSDITEGKQVIQSGKPITIGKDAIIVDIDNT